MALKQRKETRFGMAVDNAYVRIESVFLSNKTEAVATVNWYYQTDKQPFFSKVYGFAYNFDGKNIIAQGYDYLKTLEEFTGATDC